MYKAKVVKLSVKPHPNADRLQLGFVQGIQVIVGLDVQDGDVGVFFPCDGQLAEEFLSQHNLYRHAHLNQDATKTGYFGDNGRVTAEKIRGEMSDGFWCPLSYFEYTGHDVSKLQIGDEFDELNKHKICQKYYTPATRKAMRGTGKAKRTQAEYNLPRHYDTEQLVYNLDKIEPGDTITISEKVHGTSTRIGNIQVEREIKLTWWQKMFNRLPLSVKYPEMDKRYEFAVGTRNTIASGWVTPESNEWYRIETAEPLRGQLKKGEVVYAEIVGYDSHGKLIMNPQGTSKLPEVRKRYGEVMEYRYGCRWNEVGVPQRKMFVYRISNVNEDGIEVDLPWRQMKARAAQLGLEVVPVLCEGGDTPGTIRTWGINDYDIAIFMDGINELVRGASTLDGTHIREGVVVRVEKADGDIKAYKHKSDEFKILEGILKTSDDYVDAEEIA